MKIREHWLATCSSRIVKNKLIVLSLLAVGTAFAQLSVGVRIGAPPQVRIQRVQPRSPGPAYSWIAGYWYPVGNRYKWHEGYWTRPAYSGARWVAPRHDGERFYEGYWEGDRGQLGHDHRWDRGRDRNRDYDRHDERR
jgi:hypothetical protein